MLNQILAQIFDRFKAGSPKAYTAISIIIVGLYAAVTNADVQALIAEAGAPAWLPKVTEILTFVAALFLGTRTSRFK